MQTSKQTLQGDWDFEVGRSAFPLQWEKWDVWAFCVSGKFDCKPTCMCKSVRSKPPPVDLDYPFHVTSVAVSVICMCGPESVSKWVEGRWVESNVIQWQWLMCHGQEGGEWNGVNWVQGVKDGKGNNKQYDKRNQSDFLAISTYPQRWCCLKHFCTSSFQQLHVYSNWHLYMYTECGKSIEVCTWT